MHSKRSTAARPKGTVHVCYDDGREVIADTVQCVHCGRHWVFKPGSGRKRGWCMNCGGITCGTAACDVCTPFERTLEAEEKRFGEFARSVLGNFVPAASGLLVPKPN